MRYMLDTNICISVIRQKPESVLRKIQTVNPEDVCISSVTYAELVHGVEKSKSGDRNRLALSMMLSKIEILDFDAHAAEEYGKIRADLEKKGTVIGPLDIMIAGHAKSRNCIVVTNNTREFNRVVGLKVENWVEE